MEPTEVQEATTQQPHVRWYHIQFGRTNTSSGSPQRSRRGPTEVHNGQRRPHNTSALRNTQLGRTIHRREARRGPARYTEVTGGRYINGKPAEVPPNTQRSRHIHGGPRGARSHWYAPSGPPRPSLPSSERIWTCGGVRNQNRRSQKPQIPTRTTSSWRQGLDRRSPQTGTATKTTARVR